MQTRRTPRDEEIFENAAIQEASHDQAVARQRGRVKRKNVLSLHSGKQEHRQRIECESEAPSCRRANDPESQS